MGASTIAKWDPPTIHFRYGTNSVEKAWRGEKLATRRPYTDTNVFYFSKLVGRIVRLYEGGKYVYAVVTDVYTQKLGEVTDDDARKEGFSSLEEFKKVWREIYGSFQPDQRVVVIEFVPYGCWRFVPSRSKVVISSVEAPLCRFAEEEGIGRGCAFCWLLPTEWCGNCAYLRISGGKRVCLALGMDVEISRLRVKLGVKRSCEFYRRNIPTVVEKGFRKLAEKGVSKVY